MERLPNETLKNAISVYKTTVEACKNHEEDYNPTLDKVTIKFLEELQAYRAIGNVEDLKTMKENGAFSGLELAQICAMQMKLKKYQEAEHQGQLRAVPLKIGDEAWAIRNYNGAKRAQKGTVREMFYTQDMRLCIAVDRVARGEFGKKIFRTQEEAEAAIGRGM